jgi:putative transferase (TIGR04331 family)
MKKFLILTTSNEFKNNKKHIYPYVGFTKNSQKNNSYNLDAFATNKKKQIYKDCQKIYFSILDDICKNLNNLHKINWSKRSWEIYLGHWLRRYVYICYNKVYLFEKILKNEKIEKIIVSDNANHPLATKETLGIYDACKNASWESIIFSRIANEYKSHFRINFSKKKDKPNLKFLTSYEKSRFYKLSKLKKFIWFLLNRLSFLFKKNNDILLMGSCLNLSQIMFFYFKKKQFPQLWIPKQIHYPSKLSISERAKLDFKKTKISFVEKIARTFLETALPISCVESFHAVQQSTKLMNFPKNPKKIYTAQSFDSNEIFKMHTSNCINNNSSQYYVGQHGNNYFTKLDFIYGIEYRTCDYFISWGKNNLKKTIPTCNFRVQKPIKREKKFLSIICRAERNRWEPVSRPIEIENDLQIVKKLIDFLPAPIKKNITIKLRSSHKNSLHFKKQKIIINNNIPFISLMKKTKIAFFNYDSTGFLENLNLDIPTIACWPDLFGHLHPKAIADYKRLVDAKIIFKSPFDAAKHISQNWNNIDEWWSSKKVKSTVIFFKSKYSKDSFNYNFAKKLSNIL